MSGAYTCQRLHTYVHTRVDAVGLMCGRGRAYVYDVHVWA